MYILTVHFLRDGDAALFDLSLLTRSEYMREIMRDYCSSHGCHFVACCSCSDIWAVVAGVVLFREKIT